MEKVTTTMTAQNTNDTATILSKLSIGTMGLKGASILGRPAEERSIKLATIYGQVGGFKKVEDKLSGVTHEPLTGIFEGISHLDNGKLYQSGILYLPVGSHDQLLDAAKKLMSESDSVDFALDIFAVRSTNAAGYTYEAKSLMKPVGVDPLDAIRKQLPGFAALNAPSPVAQIEAPKAEATPVKATVAAKK